MARINRLAAIAALGLMFAACAAQAKKQLVDPFPLRLPLIESGSLEIDGHVVGQPRIRDGIVYLATREGDVMAVVVPSRSVLWRFKADHPISKSPELSADGLIICDEANVIWALDAKGRPVLEAPLAGNVTTAVRAEGGKAYFGTADGTIAAVDIAGGGRQVLEYRDPSSDASITAGPVFAGDLVIFGRSDGRLLALDHTGMRVWEFGAAGPIRAEPAIDRGRLFFGTADRSFYCLNASTGRKLWSRRLQGALSGVPLVSGGRLAIPAANSVVYLIARRGGSIVSWLSVPSRIVYDLAAAGPLILSSSAASAFAALDPRTGQRLWQHEAPGPLAAGAIWSPPFVVLIVEEERRESQRIVFLKSGAARG